MIDYSPIEVHMRRAGLKRTAHLSEVIADGILATWTGIKQLQIAAASKLKMLVQSPDSYSTAMPRRF